MQSHGEKIMKLKATCYIMKAIWTLSLCVCVLSLIGRSAMADAKQYMIYDVYAGGIHAVEAELKIEYPAKDRYHIMLDSRTRGFLGRLAPWSGTFESKGWKIGDARHPEIHRSSSTWRGEQETKTYSYTKAGGFKELMIDEHGKEPYKKEAPDEVTKNTTDAFSAALMILENVHKGEKCEGRSEVFDGKRRFAQIFTHVEDVYLEQSRYNIYQGAAAECIVEIEPINGEWSSKPRGWLSIQEQGRDRGMMPTVWIGSMTEHGPAIPVKIRVKTAYGTLFMHLAEYHYDDNILVADKRKD